MKSCLLAFTYSHSIADQSRLTGFEKLKLNLTASNIEIQKTYLSFRSQCKKNYFKIANKILFEKFLNRINVSKLAFFFLSLLQSLKYKLYIS